MSEIISNREIDPSLLEGNIENLPIYERAIVSVVAFSSDGKVLRGQKEARGGGVYSDKWHIPGGGIENSETNEEAALRELLEEVEGLGLDISAIQELPPEYRGSGASPKTLEDGTKVWCVMDFVRFKVKLGKTAEELEEILKPGSDFVKLKFFAPEELVTEEGIPGGVEEKIVSGELTPES